MDISSRKYLICSPSYSENNGGAIVLHKLCHLINDLGHEAYLFPFVDNHQLNRFNYKKTLVKFFKKHLREPFRRFKTNPEFKTPVLKKRPKDIGTNSWVVIYPEIIFGNPLEAKNVVRWLLHNPGHDPNTGKETKPFFYGPGELYFRIGSWFKEFHYPGSTTSNNFLSVFHYPTNLYNTNNVAPYRKGTAYAIRKGVNKRIVHDLNDSILIDNLRHEEISKIFKKVDMFISYDSYTTFSFLAALCGCKSVVIPDPYLSEEAWIPREEDRYGVAYGFENIKKAISTQHLLTKRLIELENKSIINVKNFITEMNLFFNKNG